MRDAPYLEGETLLRWRVYLEISKNRNYTQAGPLPISDGNLMDYYRVNRIPASDWDDIADFVSRYDDLWLAEYFKAADAARATKKT